MAGPFENFNIKKVVEDIVSKSRDELQGDSNSNLFVESPGGFIDPVYDDDEESPNFGKFWIMCGSELENCIVKGGSRPAEDYTSTIPLDIYFSYDRI